VKPVPDKLFDEGQRSDSSPARDTEPSFRFLNRRAGAFWDRVRDETDTWYADFPDDNRDLRNRFRKDEKDQHLAAWWELYMHRLFRRLGYKVEVHPDLSGARSKPDFLVSEESAGLYVESAAIFNSDDIENAAGRAWICECVNSAQNTDFMVDLDIEEVGIQQPRRRQIVAPLEEWLATLDWAAARADLRLTSRQPWARHSGDGGRKSATGCSATRQVPYNLIVAVPAAAESRSTPRRARQ